MKENREIKLISGNANLPLAENIAKHLKVGLAERELTQFRDGETYTSIQESVRGCDVFVIQPTSKHVNNNLMELAVMIDALKRASAGRVTAVMPYYGYARQDRKVKPRDPITAKLVANLITAAGADRVLTVDLHAQQIQGFFDIPVDHLIARPLLADYFKKKKVKNLVIVAPDAGAAKPARKFAEALDASLAVIDKRRDKPNEIAKMEIIGDVKGKNCIIFDDMIDTAGTMQAAANLLKEEGAEDVYICATHAVLSNPAMERLADPAIKEVVVTDTIYHEELPGKFTILSVAGLIGEAIKIIHTNKSLDQFLRK